MKIYDKLVAKEDKIAVVGLGYVGLPIALEFAKITNVIGFDINTHRVSMMKNKIDPSNELISSDFDNCSIEFTHKVEDLKEAKFFIVAVPTQLIKVKNLILSHYFLQVKRLERFLKREIMWFMNLQYIQDAQKKIVFQFWKN